MTNLDVRFVKNDLVKGQPIATYVAMVNKIYFATYEFNYFTMDMEDININNTDIQTESSEEWKLLRESINNLIVEDIALKISTSFPKPSDDYSKIKIITYEELVILRGW